MKFLVDNQLPVALARYLSSRGVDCHHVLDLNLAGSPDAVIWKHASQNGYVVISKDEDFLHLAGMPGATARLVWIRLGNCRTKTLLTAMERLWPKIEAALMAGEQVVEVR